MLNIWLKGIQDNKMVYQSTLKLHEPYSRKTLEYMIKTLLEQADLPSPVFLESHFLNFERFKSAKFLKRDFVESLPYDSIEVVDISK